MKVAFVVVQDDTVQYLVEVFATVSLKARYNSFRTTRVQRSARALPEWIARLGSPKCCRARSCFQASLAALVVVALPIIPSPARPKIALWLIVVLWPVIIPWAVILASIIVVVRAPRGIIALAVIGTLAAVIRLPVALIEIVK